jgi:polysaccharide export outer membrane protein
MKSYHKYLEIIMKPLFALAFTVLAGCGSAYISPTVEEVEQATADTAQVKVVALTVAIARQANRSGYTPRSIPAAFSHIAQMPVTQGTGALPDQALDPQRRPPTPELIVPPALPETPYRIGVADVLILATPSSTTSVEQLTGLLAAQSKRQGYTVQSDGAIAIPDVGRANIAGLTLEEAEAEIFQLLVQNQLNPTFSLEISEFRSQSVAVGGAVRNPGLLPVSLKSLKLEQALLLSGGVSAPDIDYATVRLYRDGKLYQIPLKNLFSSTKLKRIRLKDGDSVFVDTDYDLAKAQAYFQEQITLLGLRSAARTNALTQLNTEFSIRQAQAAEARENFTARVQLGALQRDYVYLTGEIAKQGRFPLPFESKATLADALFSQQGFATREGNPRQIYLIRSNEAGDSITAYQLNAQNIAHITVATRMELRPNDIIFVAEQPVTKWNRAISQIGPSLITAGAAAVAN